MSSAALQVITPGDTTALAVVQPPRLGLLRPIAAPAEVLRSQEEARALVQETLKEGRDYGKIPGVDKPSLLKPGAERLNLAFGCAVRFRLVTSEVEHDRPVPWRKTKAIYEGPKGNRRKTGEEVTEGASVGLYRYVFEAEIVHRESGQVVASCVASCSSMESKYIDRPRDSENTIIKMAEKRALVGATLLAYGLSEQFTQDVEDLPREAVAGDAATDDDAVKCQKCSGPVWDNRAKNDEREKEGKKRMPDYKCKDAKCETVIWDAAKYAEEIASRDAAGKANGGANATAGASSTPSTPPSAANVSSASNSSTMAEPAATEAQITRILELCEHTTLDETRLAAQIRGRIKKPLTAARADETIAYLSAEIAKVIPKSVTDAPPAPAPVVVADSATIHELSTRYTALIANERISPKVRNRVRDRILTSELTLDALTQAILELEDGELPF